MPEEHPQIQNVGEVIYEVIKCMRENCEGCEEQDIGFYDELGECYINCTRGCIEEVADDYGLDEDAVGRLYERWKECYYSGFRGEECRVLFEEYNEYKRLSQAN